MKKIVTQLTLLVLAFGGMPSAGQTLYPNDDVFVETSTSGITTTTYNGAIVSSQIVFGLGAANGTSTGRRRSYLEFTLGNAPVTSATLRLYNYWGANMGSGGNPAANATLRLRGTLAGTPVQITEPAGSVVTSWVPPSEASFATIGSDLAVAAVGWYDLDITAWYNARLGQTTTLLLRGAAISGYDFPLFEDRENTAFNNHSANTIPDSGPRIVLNDTNTPPPPPPPQLAFPGAEGFGAYAVGGRGGDVYYVTNLNDSGAGSLRNGITTASGPRTIVFAVSGNILLQSILYINKPNITIAGQTAPGDGICIRDYSLNIGGTHDTIVRGLRLRRGDVVIRATGQPTGSTGLDTVSIDDSSNVIFDHCSLSWSCDEIFGIVQNQNVTVQWCIISEPLGDPVLHPYGASHAYGLNCSATTLSIHHNLVARYVFRGPQFEPNDAVAGQGYENWMEAVNNVLYDYSSSGSRYRSGVELGAGNIPFRFHFINNFYIRGPGHSGAPEIEVDTQFPATNTVKVHVKGNLGPSRTNDSADEWAGVWTQTDTPIRNAAADVQSQMSDVPLFTPPVPVTAYNASNSYKRVVSLAGYSNVRDAVDNRVLSNVVSRVFGAYLHSQSDVGGWPALNSYNVPTDTDRDGMPDYWENANGLNPDVANNNHLNPDGYTDLEQYLNWLADLHAVGAGNSPVDVNLRTFTFGMASNATYAVFNPTNGTVTLLGDGRTARFTPAPDFFGQAGFQFTAADTRAGGGMTNIIGLIITPPPPRFVNVSASVGMVVMGGIGFLTNHPYYLVAATNAALPLNNWTRIATNQFDASANFILTNTPIPDWPQTFYRLQLP